MSSILETIPGISVVVPTHNPRPALLPGLLAALHAQTLAAESWELILVDNASSPPVSADFAALQARNVTCRIVREPQPGLTYARLAGFAATNRALITMLDDDNLPAPDFLKTALEFAAAHPEIGTFGGKIVPEFEVAPPPWFAAAGISLGCRDLGTETLLVSAESPPRQYPAASPIGAGMVLRSEVARLYREHVNNAGRTITDRQGQSLSSGGDCEIVLVGLFARWGTAYLPRLQMKHLISKGRLQVKYLARLNRESTRSWVQLLARFDLNPWLPIARWTLPLRIVLSWIRERPWTSPLAEIRWSGARGQFEGRADLNPPTR